MTEDEMVGRYHRLDGYEFERVLGVGDGQGSLACCSPWGCKELGTTADLTDSVPSHLQKLCFLLVSQDTVSSSCLSAVSEIKDSHYSEDPQIL